MRVVLGVSAGIAAYKAAALLRLFTEAGHEVTVVPTEASLRFVGLATWEALSGRPVATDVWTSVEQVRHVRIGQEADLVVVAPATADLLARAAAGMADDLLTATLLTARCPVVYAPAMHTEMWQHPATRANVATLRARGAHVVEPASGRLTGADSGPGRLPESPELYAACLAIVAGGAVEDRWLHGRHVVVTAGGTREPLDPVRYLGNRSSGKQGYALAEAAAARGAQVTLVAANTALATPAGVDVVRVETARDLQAQVEELAWSADAVVMAAAVADFRPAHYADHKIKKVHLAGQASESIVEPAVELVRNPDILAGLVAGRTARGLRRPLLVGFAAETGDETGSVLDLARAKQRRKGCDVLVANEVGRDLTFGSDTNTVHLLFADCSPDVTIGPASKRAVADGVWDGIRALLVPPVD